MIKKTKFLILSLLVLVLNFPSAWSADNEKAFHCYDLFMELYNHDIKSISEFHLHLQAMHSVGVCATENMEDEKDFLVCSNRHLQQYANKGNYFAAEQVAANYCYLKEFRQSKEWLTKITEEADFPKGLKHRASKALQKLAASKVEDNKPLTE